MVSSSRLPYTCTPSERQSAPSTRELRSIGLAARQLQQARSLLKGGTPAAPGAPRARPGPKKHFVAPRPRGRRRPDRESVEGFKLTARGTHAPIDHDLAIPSRAPLRWLALRCSCSCLPAERFV